MFQMLSLLITVLVGFSASAQSEDGNRNLLIEKLDKIYLNLAANDSSKVPVTLRLADLYAERARIASMRELESGCTVCNAGVADRKKALRLYNEVLSKTPEATQGKVMIQVGHLYQLTGDEAKAVDFYQKILSGGNTPALKAEASLALGEIHFKRRDYAKAGVAYKAVLENPAAASKGLAAYRTAWVSFNLGQVDQAIREMTQVLQTPALLTRSSNPSAPIDPHFHEEVSRDYATFLSKRSVAKTDVENLYKLSPENAKIANVQTLAMDAERLGKKSEALTVWGFIYPYLRKPEDKLNAQVIMAQLHYDLGDKKAALASYEAGLQLSRDLQSCGSAQCDELRRRARQFVVGWNQSEKKNPTQDLLVGYQQYLASFPNDTDMSLYAAVVAKDLKDYKASYGYYEKARLQLQGNPKEAKKLETTLLSQIEVAETSKDSQLMATAYESYLANSPTKEKAFDVSYQKARATYDQGQYAAAAEAFRELALSPKGDGKLKKQAADLSLDALVLAKDEARLGVWANEYSQKFQGESADFAQIAQKSVLTKSVAMADGNSEQAYAALLAFQPAKASPEDRIKYYKNKLILAERLKKFPEAQGAVDDLLKQPGLSVEDQEFAWGRKAFISEMMLDFGTAKVATEKLQKTLKPEDKALKLAMFSELSGQNSLPYYGQYLKASNDQGSKKLVAAELVRKSKDAEKEIAALRVHLDSDPRLMAELYAEAFAKKPSPTILKKVSSDTKLKSTDSGKLLVRMAFLDEFQALQKQVSAQTLDTTTDRKLAASIKQRGQSIEKVEGLVKKAIQESDWTSQLVSIDLLGKEAERFYQDLMSAPMPKGLTPEEEGEYLNLLGAQAAPFQTKSAEAKAKVEQFWKNDTWQSALKTAWENLPLRKLIAREAQALAAIAPEGHKSALAAYSVDQATTVAEVKAQRPSPQEVLAARRMVVQNPLDQTALQGLLAVEKRSENQPMVQYLQTRIETLNKGVL